MVILGKYSKKISAVVGEKREIKLVSILCIEHLLMEEMNLLKQC